MSIQTDTRDQDAIAAPSRTYLSRDRGRPSLHRGLAVRQSVRRSGSRTAWPKHLTDELTTGLARIRNSFVIARNVDSDDRTVGRPSF